jgi:hypothetical protein
MRAAKPYMRRRRSRTCWDAPHRPRAVRDAPQLRGVHGQLCNALLRLLVRLSVPPLLRCAVRMRLPHLQPTRPSHLLARRRTVVGMYEQTTRLSDEQLEFYKNKRQR